MGLTEKGGQAGYTFLFHLRTNGSLSECGSSSQNHFPKSLDKPDPGPIHTAGFCPWDGSRLFDTKASSFYIHPPPTPPVVSRT